MLLSTVLVRYITSVSSERRVTASLGETGRQTEPSLCVGQRDPCASGSGTCAAVDAPQSSHQADAHHEGEEHDSHHGSALQLRAWGGHRR